ncbi:hydroxymethylglutaryl-CoA reductase, degradative [Janibacter cremeus]|uniref:hydroxymethylglutaryl-CoA reductase, degradative n=1 Tax=Janibacter cremeus TaxID=1285192 RepID=UPI0023F8FD90|nr:hydroxymethylglutaryl-CoA reductase, degradative [Janibacter cremeus]WEV78785.1 hydroxymethylglutaryl-CoA reductase, degradative [Janibacter cremeus]
MARTSRPTGFRQESPSGRRDIASEAAGLPPGSLEAFTDEGGLGADRADHMIENVVGVFGVPVGLATNFIINGSEVLVPMATEEPSVVAAASNAARIARATGGFHASCSAPEMQAQIQVVDVPDPEAACLRVLAAREELMVAADEQDTALVSFGGGVRDIVARTVHTRVGTHVVVHLVVDVRDAMGANAVNTMAEALAPRIAELTRGRTLLRILTNKADRRLARAHAVLDSDELGGRQVVRDMVAAAALAEADPYRAATHNKGIMNGITAVALATGNDTRAIEAGAHSHAVTADGRYTALSHFEEDADGNLSVSLELPMAVGIIGGATKTHPSAGAALALMGITSADQLAHVIVSVGLAQNVAALRALATEGIQRGHMTLHRRSVASAPSDHADAT